MRHRRVAAAALQVDREHVAGREDRTGTQRDATRRQRRIHVDREGRVDGRRRVENALVLDEDACTPVAFLAGLEQQLHGPGQRVAAARQQAGGADQHGDVGIVATRVHAPLVPRRERQPRVLRHRQRVHVRAQQQRAARARAAQRRDDGAGAAARLELEVERRERLEHGFLRVGQHQAELRVLVQAPAQRDDVG